MSNNPLDTLVEAPRFPHAVVRITTSRYQTARGFAIRRDINFLVRKSDPTGIDFLRTDAEMIGAEETLRRITNLGTSQDGVYEVHVVNIRRDWEYGYIEDYDFQLVPV